VDDTTLVLRFAGRQPGLPGVLCELPIVPRHLLAGVRRAGLRQAAFERAPVGNGPFRFVSRTPNARWVLERNPTSRRPWAGRRACDASWWRWSTSPRPSSRGW
jgi:ABC-type oligopeptide transport system substrate-binding subunit